MASSQVVPAKEPFDGEWCQTKFIKKNLKFKWSIENFAVRNIQNDERIESPKFSGIWRLLVCGISTNNGSSRISTSTGISIGIKSVSTATINANVKFWILSGLANNIKYEEKTFNFSSLQPCCYSGFSIDRNTIINHLNGYLPQGTLTIQCELDVVDESSGLDKNPDAFAMFENAKVSLCSDLGTLFDNKILYDVTLLAGGHELKAHKAVLAARSKVFAAMFEHDMKEQKLNQITITDIDHKVLEEMLRYMYTALAPNLNKMVEDLLMVADKYELDSLKQICVESLLNNMSIENASNLLILADRHSVKKLKLNAIDFILKNAKSFMEIEGWKDLQKHSNIMVEVLSLLAEKLKIT